jgi:CubicO group peptidase (beta-lactamase class C family)
VPEALAAELGLKLRRAQAESRLPAVNAAVFRRGELVWSDALGLADVEERTPARPDTQFRIGSITKTFTAAAVLLLRERGLLSLDDELGAHVDGIAHGGVTLRRLLAHHGGLQREPPGEIWESLDPPEREAFLASVADAEQVLDQGAHWHYSNLGYALLGEVVERASGRPYRELVDAELLGPLGLERTTWAPEPPAARGYLVHPWSDAPLPEQPVDLRGTSAAGQLWSTVGDLARWGAALSHPADGVLSEESLELMHALQVMADPEQWSLGWALGLALFRRGDRVWAGHGGAMPGHLAGLVLRREERVGAAVLTNAGAGAAPEQLALELAERLLELHPPEPDPWRPGGEPPPDVAPLLGRWWSEGHEFLFRWRDGSLEALLPSAPPHRQRSAFRREAEDRWRVESGRELGELLRVVRDEAGEPVRLYWATYAFTRRPEVFGGD